LESAIQCIPHSQPLQVFMVNAYLSQINWNAVPLFLAFLLVSLLYLWLSTSVQHKYIHPACCACGCL